jgi:hypothetical protein
VRHSRKFASNSEEVKVSLVFGNRGKSGIKKQSSLRPRRKCFGDYDSGDDECRFQCVWRKTCAEDYYKGAVKRSRGVEKVPPKKSPKKKAEEVDEYPDVEDVDPGEDESMASVFFYNAALSAMEETGHEFVYMVRSVPRKKYDFSPERNRRRKDG